MKIKNHRDFWSGVMFVAIGVIFAVGATNYSMGSSARPGPGYFPLILSVILALLGLVELFKAMTIESEGGNPIGKVAWRPLIVIVLAIAIFGATINLLGMIIAIPILIIITSLAGDEFGWKGVIGACVVLTAGSWAIFILGLKLTIPLWPSFIAG